MATSSLGGGSAGGPARGSAPAAAPNTYPTLNLSGIRVAPAAPAAGPTLGAQAAALARQTIAGQVAADRASQAAIELQARQTAGQIGRATRAAAGFLRDSGLAGGLTAQDYANAVAQTQGLASGYSGQLRNDVLAGIGSAQNTLSNIPGNTQTVHGSPDDISNLLYGLRGNVPGTALATEGLGATATARALPANLLATGLNEGLGVLGAGRTDAAKYGPQIAAQEGRLPGLTQSYLSTLTSQALKENAANAPHITSSGGGIYSVDPQTGQVTTLKAPPASASSTAPKLYSLGGGLYSYDPTTGTLSTLHEPPAGAGTKPQIIGSSSSGYYQIVPGKKPILVIPPVPSSSSGFNLSPGGARYDANGNLIASLPANPSAASTSSGDFTIGNTRYHADGTPIVTGKSSGTSKTGGVKRTDITAFQRIASQNAKGAPQRAQGSPYQYVTGGDPAIPVGQAGSAWIRNPNYTPATPGEPTPYWETVNQGVISGLSIKQAEAITNNTKGYDVEGLNGRPYTGSAAVTESVKGARQAIRAGATLPEALGAAAAAGLIDPRVYTPIFTKAYGNLLGLGGRTAGKNPQVTVTRPTVTRTTRQSPGATVAGAPPSRLSIVRG